MNLGDSTQRDALARVIATRFVALSLDELRVVDVVTARMLGLGRETYGPLVIADAHRDWSKETADELADAVFYVACRAIAANDARLERIRCEAADELAAASGGCTCRRGVVPCALHVEPIEAGLRELTENTIHHSEVARRDTAKTLITAEDQ